jgi:putative membrane protein
VADLIADRRSRTLRPAADVLRGAMIGAVEVVPGVSGGTVALIVGVYGTLIDAASRVVRGTVSVTDLLRGRGLARSRAHFAAVPWRIVLPVLGGMVVAVLLGARLLAPLIDAYPVQTRAVFCGLIAASVLIPARMLGRRWSWPLAALATAAAVAAFVLTGLPAGRAEDPSLVLVALAAAVAICALVLPGVSGAFLLLVFGMYEATLAAVNARDVPYLLAFAAGAVVGLALFVNLLKVLLARYETLMLALMAGLMLGSLRALWPWQDETGTALAPPGDVVPAVLLAAGGAAVVLLAIALQARLGRARATAGDADGMPSGEVDAPKA